MSGWTVSRYSEQDGLVVSTFPWSPVSESAFLGDWNSGQYGVVNWSGHGWPNGVSRTIWDWDDGDSVPEGSEMSGQRLIDIWSTPDTDYPSIVTALSCLVGYPELNSVGNIGIDLLTKPSMGSAAAIVSLTRVGWISRDWLASPGASESVIYEFNRFMIDGPDGPEKIGDALFDAKFYIFTNFSRDHFSDNNNLYGYNLYGDPAMVREGVTPSTVPDSSLSMIFLIILLLSGFLVAWPLVR
jgi:hypothetical protein